MDAKGLRVGRVTDPAERSAARPTIDPGSSIGPVHLTTRDLDRSARFYVERLGLELRPFAGGARLVSASGPLVVLWEDRDAPRAHGTTGLYHFAIVLPSRRDLGRLLVHLLATETRLAGASDHGVSEALYLSDPEGNGIELYRDRPRSEWIRDGDQVVMVSDPLDIESLIAAAGGEPAWSGIAAGARVGHIHLRVGDLLAAERYYGGVLGFETRARIEDSAVFLAAGGYHHHIGANTWAGAGAPPPPAGAAGLRAFVIEVPDATELARVADRVRGAGSPYEEQDDGFASRDPSGNRVLIQTRR